MPKPSAKDHRRVLCELSEFRKSLVHLPTNITEDVDDASLNMRLEELADMFETFYNDACEKINNIAEEAGIDPEEVSLKAGASL